MLISTYLLELLILPDEPEKDFITMNEWSYREHERGN
jgi:hypothetical protein